MMPLDGIEIVVSPQLAGCKRGVIEGHKAYVSPAFADLLRNAKNQKELAALLESFEVINITALLPNRHAVQWNLDGFQSTAAQREDAFRELSELPR